MTIPLTADLLGWISDERARRAGDLRFRRFHLLRRLRLGGVAEVICTYDAYGDSGNWEEVSLDGGCVTPPGDLRDAIGDFTWDVAYHHHPGFENNEGGYGEMTWDIGTDTITLDHADRFIETSHSHHEGI